MKREDINAVVQEAYEKTLNDMEKNINNRQLTQAEIAGYILLYSGKLTAHILESLGLMG